MKLRDMTTKSHAELIEIAAEGRRTLSAAIIDSRTKEERNTKRQAAAKRTIARALTLARQHELTKLEETS